MLFRVGTLPVLIIIYPFYSAPLYSLVSLNRHSITDLSPVQHANTLTSSSRPAPPSGRVPCCGVAASLTRPCRRQVPETIEALLAADIHVWVLTGDKQETAINIGHSSRLLHSKMPLLILNEDGLDVSHETERGGRAGRESWDGEGRADWT